MADIFGSQGQVIQEVQVRGAGGSFLQSPGLPAGAIPVSAANAGLVAQAGNAALVSVAGKTTYLVGFYVVGFGSTAGGIITVTLGGLLGGSMLYQFVVPVGAAVAAQSLYVEFAVPIPANAPNVNITVAVPSFGVGNTGEGIGIHGYNL